MAKSFVLRRLALVASLLGCSGALAGCVAGDESFEDEDIAQDNDAVGAAVNLVNPGFESSKTGWGSEDLFAISTSDKHTGSKSAKLASSGNKIAQTVTVSPNTTYTLSAWVLGKGTVGVKSGASTLASKSASGSSWTKVSVDFSSGSATSVQIYGAYNGGEGRFDDFAVTAKSGGGGSGGSAGSSGSSGAGASSGSSGAGGSSGSSGAGGSSGSSGSSGAGGSSGTGGAGGSSSADYPSDVLDLLNWHLTLPIDTPHEGTPDEIDQPELDTYSLDPYFHLNAAKDGVVFRAFTNGVTTSGSGYPRSELRERTNNGKDHASWSSSSGKHTMFIDEAVTHLPDVKPHIVVGQIHDASDDVIVIRLEGSKLFVDLNGADGPTLTSSYALGTRFTIKMEVQNNAVNVYYNGSLKYTYNKSFSGAYFKAGAYVQSSCQGTKKVSGESCSAYGEAVIYGLSVQHQ